MQYKIGDCLSVMRELPSESFDAIVTDPPFGVGFKYATFKDPRRPEDYWSWLEPRYEEMMRLLRPGGLLAIWQAQLNFPHFWEWFGERIHIYISAKNFNQIHTSCAINYAYDPIVMAYKPGASPRRPQNPRRSIDWFVADLASIVPKQFNVEKNHPCPRPLDQVREILSNFVIEGGSVLDPFLGSGTVLLGCIQTGRSGFGIEIDETYEWIIKERLRAARIESWGESEGEEPAELPPLGSTVAENVK